MVLFPIFVFFWFPISGNFKDVFYSEGESAEVVFVVSVVSIALQQRIEFCVLFNWLNVGFQSSVVLFQSFFFSASFVVFHQLISDFDVAQSIQHINLLLDEFKIINQWRISSSKVVRNQIVESVGSINQPGFAWIWILEQILNFGQGSVTIPNLLLANVSKRHLLNIDIHSSQLFFHHLLIEDERDQFLNSSWKAQRLINLHCIVLVVFILIFLASSLGNLLKSFVVFCVIISIVQSSHEVLSSLLNE
mmetsp:Transcript_16422/g.22790  ORF Transcript_16422/g.22790 Transcript_16422/m.22790 type:complete len:248 (+) Transcript_16422:526-1269(+)